MKYHDLDYAVQVYLRVLNESTPDEEGNTFDLNHHEKLKKRWRDKFEVHRLKCRTVFAGKSDLKSAFRILRLNPASWRWLVFKAKDPTSGEWKFFVDKCLPFGASISCALFQKFSNARCHLVEHQADAQGQVTNYLDDFLFLALTMIACNRKIEVFLMLCEFLGVPVSMEKTEWAQEDALVVFLGILLNGREFCLEVPLDKKDRALSMLQDMLNRKKSKVKNLQALCGYLNFLSKAIFPGRTFIRRMYSKFSEVINVGGHPKNAQEFRLRQYHHVCLDAEFKEDCEIWCNFLQGDLAKVVNRPMVDLLDDVIKTSTDICFYSDTSAAKDLGFGALLNTNWIQQFWGQDFVEKCNPSIEYLELYTLVAGVITWEDHEDLINCQISVFCDNQAVVNMINSIKAQRIGRFFI